MCSIWGRVMNVSKFCTKLPMRFRQSGEVVELFISARLVGPDAQTFIGHAEMELGKNLNSNCESAFSSHPTAVTSDHMRALGTFSPLFILPGVPMLLSTLRVLFWTKDIM